MNYVSFSLIIFQCLLILFWGYWLFISLFGFWEPRKLKEKSPKKRFLLLIPAHNEETVIGSLVENLLNLDYPDKLYDILVIADNCTDTTPDLVHMLGASVIKHSSPPDEPKGKPYAIRYALEQIGSDLTKKYDGVAVFDADNLVSANYLKEMNKHFLKGDKVVQCFLDSKNPEDNWVTLAYSTSFYFANRFFQLAKTRLGLSNFIGGTGFCVDSKLLEEIGWTAKSLTEDLEFTIQCILRGIPVNWCHTARVFDEKPESFKASCVQRMRWARGHWDVTFRYSHKLLMRAFFKCDIKAIDAFLYLINPGKMVLAALTSLLLFFDFTHNELWVGSVIPWYAWVLFIIYYFMFIAYPMVVDIGIKSFGKILKACLSMSMMFYSNVPLYFWAFFTKKNKTWKRTDHTKNISISEMNEKTGMEGVKKTIAFEEINMTMNQVALSEEKNQTI
ncbi:cellulose synthase/poly-beta-1,6-N-acetylglucosamine synthase-like glycosyltransferase [Scopulibacillus darangshiensis]|uniref:Cellulose synthase/poly-beta-1,6-N-acetylglucosamine synthase-like glycosyltransferase n=1 Tax=Scopulibacillus darangshiensis TaxID=442528 RepID=A0A4R2P331_9BACL|nr:glycosyltransferase family 2 protein [Scopulibacillus darangshiensis]TCP28977.1 cellulose synthase/poly-beta-1,6-N-acetylglucosamine synthase-like glycosyltransferase [Scopulibacillus darangshiensis]